MATFNNAHHESGGVILFQGELILLFCENVNLNVPERKIDENGKLYLTTHRMIFTNSKMQNNLKSLSIPFYTMMGLKLEQPIFGANYIQGVSTEAVSNKKFTFKLKFSSGGCTEYGQALSNAARAVRNMTQQSGGFQPPPAYNTNPASQYYQAPPNVYQPAYNCGFALPNDIFNQPPPAGFIYASEAPPPYPGLNTKDNPPASGYPTGPKPPQSNQPTGGYPGQQQPGFGGGPPPPGYPGGQPQAAGGYPNQPGFGPQPGFAPQAAAGGGGYPSQPGFSPGSYPSQPQQQNGYRPQQPYNPGTTNEQNQQSSQPPSLYPSLNDFPSAPPSAPPPP